MSFEFLAATKSRIFFIRYMLGFEISNPNELFRLHRLCRRFLSSSFGVNFLRKLKSQLLVVNKLFHLIAAKVMVSNYFPLVILMIIYNYIDNY